ncbi:MAG: protein translocase subunit SecD, partial [Parcubacteria group bacterium]|nr:protein translocase subunit SecD [Parcubacteria group bacterium]
MSVRGKIWLTFLGILVLAGLAGLVDWPKGPNIDLNSIRIPYEKELKVHLGLDLQGGAHLIYQADLSNIAPEDYDSSMEGVRDVIERRVNALGVSEPVVQTVRAGGQHRLVVELAGVTDISQAIAAIGETPSLDFREQIEAPAAEEASTTIEEIIPPNTEEGDNEAGGEAAAPETTSETTDTVTPENVIDTSKLKIEGEGDDSQIVDEEGNPVDMDALSQLLQQQQEQALGFRMTKLTGQHLNKAQLQFDQQTNQPTISLEFNDEGKKLFAEITEKNVGKPIAIFLDGAVISAPTVNEPIRDGSAIITGQFTLDEAKELAMRLNAGALPVPIELLSQNTIGATLGKSSVEKSFLAGLIGLALVCLFMIIYYRLPGVLAVLALGFYALMVLALFKLIPVTLTLAGIAGFILSIGMAVDANVLIFERVKEE